MKNAQNRQQVPRILIVGAQHGDERLGPRLQRALARDTSGEFGTVEYLCGNPRAYRQNVRFTESDLNRSYNTLPPQTYEQKRAQTILRRIAQGNYAYVLDVHTAREDVGRFFLATSLNPATRHIISASPLTRVAIMPPHIADCSLIGQVPQAISIEYERTLAATPQALQELLELLRNQLKNRVHPQQRELFYVDGKIPLGARIHKDARNFEQCNLGFYPVIFGPNTSYTEYQGFAAHKRELEVI